jgi:OPT family oligopeptide transporter
MAHFDAACDKASPPSEENVDAEAQPQKAPTLDMEAPVATLRVFVVSTVLTFAWSFVNQMGNYRRVTFAMDTTVAILVSYPILLGLSKVVPAFKFRLFGIALDTNPGPFNLREHALMSCAMSDAASTAYVANTLWTMENDFGRNLGFFGDFLMIACTKLIGYGLAAFFFRFLIMSSSFPWPTAIYTVEVYSMLHDCARDKLRVFAAVFLACFCYMWLPDFLWPGLSSLAILCWFSQSRTASILGAGTSGFGILSVDLNISDVFGYFPFLLYVPAWLGVNAVIGGMLWAWVVSPILYYTNWQNARNMDPMGFGLYTADGGDYPMLELFGADGTWNQAVYDQHGSPYMSAWFAFGYFFVFMGLTASLTHTLCWHWDDCKAAFSKEARTTVTDLAMRMESLYSPLRRWVGAVLVVIVGAALVATNAAFGVEMPWWAIVVSILLAALWVLPIGAVQAVTGNQIGLNVLAELIGGLMLKHNPNGAILVKVTGYMGTSHALYMIQNFKMGQMLLVDYKVIFGFQVWGTLVTALADATAYRMVMDAGLTSGDNPEWNSSSNLMTYRTSAYMWGGIGPWNAWMGPKSHYGLIFWSGLAAGLVLPPLFYLLHTRLQWRWCKYVHVPMMSLITGYPSTNAWYLTILAMVLAFQVLLPRFAPAFHKKYGYVTVAGLVGGAGIVSFVVAMLTGFGGVDLGLPAWTAADAGCTAAQDPTSA